VRVQVDRLARGARRAAATIGRGPLVAGGAATLVLALAAGSNWAQQGVDVRFHSFQDTRGVTVLEPMVDLDKDFTDRTGLKLKFGIDAVSAASDACARCHPDGSHSQRSYVDADLRRTLGAWKLDVGGELSRENFYAADTGMVSVSRDLNQGNTTIAGGYSFSLNRPMLHPSRSVEHQYEHNVTLGVTQTLTKTTVAQISYNLDRISGYQDSPFLRTILNGQWTLGNVPDLRTRQAVSVKLRQALPASTYLEADFRHYWDSWALTSNTVSLGVSKYFTPAFLAGFSYRKYNQTGTFFYEPFYTGDPLFFTGDYRLSPFNSALYTGHVQFTPGDGFLGAPRGTSFDIQYERYVATNGFQSAMVLLGMHIPLWKR
jgi:hypothetical protein